MINLDGLNNLNSIIEFKYFLFYLLGINLLGFLFMKLDKKYAIKKSWRISEKTFFIISLLFGSIGVYIGIYSSRHKTKRINFTVGIPVLFVLNIICIVYLFVNNIVVF